MIEVAEGDLARRPAFGRQHELVREAGLEEARAVGTIDHSLDDPRRIGPLGALGLAR